MQKIYVPVDFSTASYDAYLYARQMAAILNTSLEVVHVMSSIVSINDPTYVKPPASFRETILERLHQFIQLSSPEDGGDVVTQLKVHADALEGPDCQSHH